MEPDQSIPSAAGIRHHLRLLELERMVAGMAGLTSTCEIYRRDLDEAIAEARQAFVAAAVTEIAVLRAQLSAPQVG